MKLKPIIASYSGGYAIQQVFDELLRSTTSGKQGVAPANMYMNLWRYIRKMTAKALYANGFFNDTIPVDGCLTVFYENNVALIRRCSIKGGSESEKIKLD
jgi:hypothetical protein